MKKIFSAAVLCALANCAFAWSLEKWELIYMEGNAESPPWKAIFLEKRPVQSIGNGRAKAWLLFTGSFDADKTIKTENGVETYQSHVVQSVFDCRERLHGQLRATFYKEASGETKLKSENFPKLDLEPVIPDSIGEGLLEEICSRAQKKK